MDFISTTQFAMKWWEQRMELWLPMRMCMAYGMEYNREPILCEAYLNQPGDLDLIE